MKNSNNQLSFRVSAGLKNIIGRDLISDKYIAVFELVKNSYDAGASKVTIEFISSNTDEDKIIISDNGSGMNYDDIVNKWLFVAYSEKKKQNRNEDDYREEIKREVAGAKGVGRFSCDRLGASLQLITKTKKENNTHIVNVNWNNFEYDDTREFMEVPVEYLTADSLPSNNNKGTVLIISKLREVWDRETILRLKRSLMKLISPDANMGKNLFDVEIVASHEIKNDEITEKKKNANKDRDIVNGLIHNDVFEKLNIRTTAIEVIISEDGRQITSRLSDRGQYIFTITEKNRAFPLLRNIHASIFYLNRSAKVSFTRQMGGVQPIKYGSIFIYKNGFRINPYGEPGQDFFNIDQRKAQGYNRFLGTREIMGRISIKGDNDQFIETSSRAHGFIITPAVEMLSVFFLDKVLKVLEKYVVNIISWGEPLKTDPSHVIEPHEVGEQIIAQFLASANPRDIISVDYNEDLLKSESALGQPDNIKSSLKKLELMAENTQDEGLIKLAKNVKSRTEEVLSYSYQVERENIEKSKELNKAHAVSTAREKQVYFLQNLTDNTSKNLVNGMHSIYTNTEVVRGYISAIKNILADADFSEKEKIHSYLSEISKANIKANKTAELAIKGNKSLKQTEQSSLSEYIRQYIDIGIALKGITYKVVDNGKAFMCIFDPASIGIILDNIVSNSLKAEANELEIVFTERVNDIVVSFKDNGVGLNPSIDKDLLFDYGLSANIIKKGFGIGLSQIKELTEEMGGSAKIISEYTDGFGLEVSIKK